MKMLTKRLIMAILMPVLSASVLALPACLSACTDQVDDLNPAGDTISNNDLTHINTMNITIGDTILKASLAKNSSTDTLKRILANGPLTIAMSDYGNMEKVGSLGQNFPRNDEAISTVAGDIILYQGNMLVIYYAPNSWTFTRLGRIENISGAELKAILGNGDVTVTLSLNE